MLGQRVRKLREANGWTQMELAERTGLSNQSISMIELGKRGAKNPPLSTIQILARAFGITVDELVAEPEPQEVA